MTASKPHSGTSTFPDTRCLAIISLNLSVLLVRDKRCLYPNAGRQVELTELQHSGSQKIWRIRFSETPNDIAEISNLKHTSEKEGVVEVSGHVLIAYLQGLASSSSVILMKGRMGFSTKEPKPIRNLLVRWAISLDREEPRPLIISRSSIMDADRSIR